MFSPPIIKYKSSNLQKELEALPKEKIDLELSKEYLECLKKKKSNEICKELFAILNK